MPATKLSKLEIKTHLDHEIGGNVVALVDCVELIGMGSQISVRTAMSLADEIERNPEAVVKALRAAATTKTSSARKMLTKVSKGLF